LGDDSLEAPIGEGEHETGKKKKAVSCANELGTIK
jgi:hypothetical protein